MTVRARDLRYARWWLTLLLCLCVWPALAASGMRLDRDRITIDETVTLTIRLEGVSTDALPDQAQLLRDFRVVGQSMSQEGDLFDPRQRVTLQLVLQPLHEGVITLPPLRTGGNAAPLRVTVLPSNDASAYASPSANGGQPIFIEASVDTDDPYVQQTVGYTVRLYHDPGVVPDGRLDVDTPEGASLLRMGDDQVDTIQKDGRYYKRIERHYLLVPERAGPLTLAPARFLGRATNVFDAFFRNSGGEIRVRSPPLTLKVRPIPADAPQPWLPLSGLTLRYRSTPTSLRVGDSAEVVVDVVADGAIAPQIADPELRVDAGAEVFADKAERSDRFVDGRPQAGLGRRFSIVPSRAGRLRVIGPRIVWWDARAGVERVASLPDLDLPVAPAVADGAAAGGRDADEGAMAARDAKPRGGRRGLPQGAWLWALMSLPLLCLLVFALVWRLKTMRDGASAPPMPVVLTATSDADADSHAHAHTRVVAPPPADAQTWARALVQGDPAELSRLLCAMASPPAADLDAVRARLAEPTQCAAVDLLQQARWGAGDQDAALAAMRAAFRDGPRWRPAVATRNDDPLPPLYPRH